MVVGEAILGSGLEAGFGALEFGIGGVGVVLVVEGVEGETERRLWRLVKLEGSGRWEESVETEVEVEVEVEVELEL